MTLYTSSTDFERRLSDVVREADCVQELEPGIADETPAGDA